VDSYARAGTGLALEPGWEDGYWSRRKEGVMDTSVWIVLIVVAVVVAAGAWMYLQRRRTEGLREQFGPEYDHAVTESGGRGRAESELQARAERVEQLNIQPLSGEDRARFSESWRSVQAQFVDDPAGAVGQADRLVADVMQTRGYPVGDFEQRASDISVDHPHVVENYRAAHAIALRNERGEASTEDLRQSMVHYRSLFEDLLGTPETEPKEARR
jgi:hypothetical protein